MPLRRPAGIIRRRWELPALFAVLARRIGHESRRPESSLEARAHRHRQPSVASKNPGTRLVHLAEPVRYLRLRPWRRIIMIPLRKEEGVAAAAAVAGELQSAKPEVANLIG